MVILNSDGWFLTAFHVIKQLQDLDAERNAVLSHRAREREIRTSNDSPKSKQKQLQSIGKLGDDKTEAYSVWWGRDGVTVTDLGGVQSVDLGIGRLTPFDPSWVPGYPEIKDPNKDFDAGTSLCKLGFPFHAIQPSYDAASNAFQLPAEAFPFPLFPIDGIYTRTIIIEEEQPSKYPLAFVETSTPGLRGQSGGPIFDTKGAVWATQAHTAHLELGFSPPVNGRPNQVEHQFLNVGRGASAATIVALLSDLGVSFKLSDH